MLAYMCGMCSYNYLQNAIKTKKQKRKRISDLKTMKYYMKYIIDLCQLISFAKFLKHIFLLLLLFKLNAFMFFIEK